jgi:hypothetical protein
LTVSKLDLSLLAIPTMYFDLGLTYVLCPFALTTFCEIGVLSLLRLSDLVPEIPVRLGYIKRRLYVTQTVDEATIDCL